MRLTPLPAETRAAVEKLVRDSALPFSGIAARTGVNPATIRTWSDRFGWRPKATPLRLDPAAWSPARRAAVEALSRTPGVSAGDLALALGGTRLHARALLSACGVTGSRRRRTTPPEPVPPADGKAGRGRAGADQAPPLLRRALRRHIARQIARFDAALSGEVPPALDSAKVLRDLGGLKRLLDEIDADDRTTGESGAGRADARDLPALRAAITRRYAAMMGERAEAGLPGEPAAADPGSGR